MSEAPTRRSETLAARALRVIPGGSSTKSKSQARLIAPTTPGFAIRASGAFFTDVEGLEWLDCDMALGAVVWGHWRAEIDDAAVRQIRAGTIFSVPHPLETEVAEKMLLRIGSYDSVRFCKSGSDAVSAAVRIARAATGRTPVASGAYHGWHDWSAFHHYRRSPRLGIPATVGATTVWLKGQNVAAVGTVKGIERLAAIVVCPEHWSAHDLRELRVVCSRTGCLLVFDEVKSGVRFARRGVCGELDIWPDLLCLGKGLGNGFPLAAIIGPRDLMRLCKGIQLTGTYAAECVSLAAADAAEDLLAEHPAWPPWRTAAIDLISRLGTVVSDRDPSLAVTGTQASFCLESARNDRSREALRIHVMRCLAARRIFSSGHIALSAAHGPDEWRRLEEALLEAVETWPSPGER